MSSILHRYFCHHPSIAYSPRTLCLHTFTLPKHGVLACCAVDVAGEYSDPEIAGEDWF
ncbi:MAG: hypothetical protein AB4040_12885 [Synechococcus sp.]